jgi:hypothetical protein
MVCACFLLSHPLDGELLKGCNDQRDEKLRWLSVQFTRDAALGFIAM